MARDALDKCGGNHMLLGGDNEPPKDIEFREVYCLSCDFKASAWDFDIETEYDFGCEPVHKVVDDCPNCSSTLGVW